MTNRRQKVFTLLLISILFYSIDNLTGQTTGEDEILYHVMQRSFFDSNGDSHGDLAGLRLKLDYLQELGATSVLLLPLYESPYYHNYFPTDFASIDQEFGNLDDYLRLVAEIHSRGMKIYMDMEVQYITEDHMWYRDAYGNPDSEYSDYLIFHGPGNTEPESIIYGLHSLMGYDGVERQITTINLNNPEVKRYIYDLFVHWTDPDKDGNFDDGVDGFRIDHMMDDLDDKGLFTNMLADFWGPLIAELKSINPDLVVIGEQADWTSYGMEYFTNADVDWMFSFGTKFAITEFNKSRIIHEFDTTFRLTPTSKGQIIFIENHDTERFPNDVGNIPGRLKVGATFNILAKGIPGIYYGQELGMTGQKGVYDFWTDGDRIPTREAFEWYSETEGPGMALWYKDTGPWWDSTNLKSNDGISLEEQISDPNSLWRYYQTLIRLRKSIPALHSGDMTFIDNGNPDVVSFARSYNDSHVMISVNLSPEYQSIRINHSRVCCGPDFQYFDLLNESSIDLSDPLSITTQLEPYESAVWQIIVTD